MARQPKGRAVSGILVLDKPQGLSSNAALQSVKRVFAARKAGHTGSLDPLATGVLPICLGEATKFSQYLLDSDKAYETTVRLGQQTDTGDAEGQVIAEAAVPPLSEAVLQPALAALTGVIEQIPPMYSALKREGQPLYKLARLGVTVEREARVITIYALKLLSWRCVDGVCEVDLRVHCSKGTYIRVLAEQFAERLGTLGHVRALRRIAAGPFTVGEARTLEDLAAAREAGGEPALDTLLVSVDRVLEHLPELALSEAGTFYLQQGQPVLVPRAPTAGKVRLRSHRGEFIGIGEILDDGRVAPRRLVVTEG